MPFFTSLFKKEKPKTELKSYEKSEIGSKFADAKPNYKIFCDEFQRQMMQKFEMHSGIIENAANTAEKIKQKTESVQQLANSVGHNIGQFTADALSNQGGPQSISNVLENGGTAFGTAYTLIKNTTEENKQQDAKNFMRINKMAEDAAAFSILCQELAKELYFRFKLTIGELFHAPGTEEGVVALAKFFAEAIEKSLKEKTLTDEELKTGELAVLMRAAIPSESDNLYYQDPTGRVTKKIRKSTKGGEEWSIQGILLHAPGQIEGKKTPELKAPNLKEKYHPIMFHDLEEAKAYGYKVNREFTPGNPVSQQIEWTPVVRNWFSDSHYEVSGSSPIWSRHKVQEDYDLDDWVFYNASAPINLTITAKFENHVLTLYVEANFNPPPSRTLLSAQFRNFFQDMVSLTVDLPEANFILDKTSIKRELCDNIGKAVPTAHTSRTTSKFRFHLFGKDVALTETTTDVNDFGLSMRNDGNTVSYSAEMKNCYDRDHNACPYNTENPDRAMHVYFRAPDRLNEPSSLAKGSLTLKTEQTYLLKNVSGQETIPPKEINLSFTLTQRLVGMSIWRGVADHQMYNEVKLTAAATLSLSNSPQFTNLEFIEPEGIKIKEDKHIKPEIAEQLSKSPITKIEWVKNDTFGCPDLVPSTPLCKN